MFLLASVRHVELIQVSTSIQGVSIQISISLGKVFLRISRIRNIPLPWILARVFAYVPPLISRILEFIYWTVLILILIYFDWRDTENQQTGDGNNRFFFLTRKWMAVLPGGQNKVAVITRRLYFTEVAVRRGFTELKWKFSQPTPPLVFTKPRFSRLPCNRWIFKFPYKAASFGYEHLFRVPRESAHESFHCV